MDVYKGVFMNTQKIKINCIPGYDGEVIPDVFASYNIVFGSESLNETARNAGIRIQMSYKEFKRLKNLLNSDLKFLKSDMPNNELQYRYDSEGYGEFYYENFKESENHLVENTLSDFGKRAELLILESLIRR